MCSGAFYTMNNILKVGDQINCLADLVPRLCDTGENVIGVIDELIATLKGKNPLQTPINYADSRYYYIQELRQIIDAARTAMMKEAPNDKKTPK